MNPGVYNERGFQWLDRIVNIVRRIHQEDQPTLY